MTSSLEIVRVAAILAVLSPAGAFSPAVGPLRLQPSFGQRTGLVRAQSGPLEDGYAELLPGRTEEGSVDPEIVARMDAEVQAISGVNLEDLLNPSKVVNLERERLILEPQIASCTNTEEKAELEKKMDKIEKQLYSEKRAVFRGWLKNVFIGQAIFAVVLGGVAAFDAFPTVTIDISLRALGFWSYWLFVIPSLRARRPKGWEKKALDVAFLGSPLITFAAPFVTKDTGTIWAANLIFLMASYAYGYFSGEDEAPAGRFSGALQALDFGSGQERGLSANAREKIEQRRKEKEAAEDSAGVES